MAQRKTALVTGAGQRRVGWHVAEMLADRGYALVLPSRRADAEAGPYFRSRGIEVFAPQVDLTNETAVQAMLDEALARFGRLDVVVTSAGLWVPKPLEDVRADDVRRHFEANTLATFLCAQQAGLRMTAQPEGGCIVLIGDWAIVRPYLGYAAYFPSKGAIPTLCRTLAVELGTRHPGVRVNCILPGPVMMPDDLPAEERAAAVRGTLVKREGTPGHVAQTVAFLMDNDFVTGVCLPVDGGRSIYAPEPE